eukprot:g23297.t1
MPKKSKSSTWGRKKRQLEQKIGILLLKLYKCCPLVFALFVGSITLWGRENPIAVALLAFLDLPQYVELYDHVFFLVSQFTRFNLWKLYYINSRVFPITALKNPCFLLQGRAIFELIQYTKCVPCLSCLVAYPTLKFARRCLDCVLKEFEDSYLIPNVLRKDLTPPFVLPLAEDMNFADG